MCACECVCMRVHVLARLSAALQPPCSHSRCFPVTGNLPCYNLHKIDNNHTIDFFNIKILDTESNRGKILFSEALFIHTQTNYMNKQYEINKLAEDLSYKIAILCVFNNMFS